MNFVPCLAWVRSGVSKSVPEKLQLTQEELKKLIDEAKADYDETLRADEESEDSEHEGKEYESKNTEEDSNMDTVKMALDDDDDDDINTKYNLDNYDEDETENNPIFSLASLSVYAQSKDDPYITVPDEDDDHEEQEDFKIRANDNLLVVGHVESDSSILEVYVYNEEEDDMYVHHDIVLPAYPLAIEWLDFHPHEEKPGNYVAVGDMTPVIKIWDLDVVDILEPDYKLGAKLKKKKKAKKTGSMSTGHTDAVLDVSWNKLVRNILSSGSADTNICIWDLQETKCISQLHFHNDKVQSLKWHPAESQILLSGGCDNMVNLFDCRTNAVCKQWSVSGEVERVLWNNFDSNYAFCSTDSGSVHCIDVREDKLAYTMKAHNDAVTGLDLSSQYPGCLVTASTDRTFKVWDVSKEPKFIASKKMKVGSIYVAKSNLDHPFTFAFGGDNQSLNLKVVDLMDISECSEHFGNSTNTAKIKAEELATGSSFPSFSVQGMKKEADVDMETELDNFQGLNLNAQPQKKSQRKNKYKNKKKYI